MLNIDFWKIFWVFVCLFLGLRPGLTVLPGWSSNSWIQVLSFLRLPITDNIAIHHAQHLGSVRL